MPGMSAAERDVWAYLAPLLAAQNLLSPLDHLSLRRICSLTVRLRKLEKEVGGVVTMWHETEHTKTQRIKPAFAALMQVAAELRQLSAAFGLDPNSRTSISSRRADMRDPSKPANSGAAHAQQPASPDGLPPKPASPIGLVANVPPRGPTH